MDAVYRTLVPIVFWLGIAALVVADVMVVLDRQFLFFLSPGGILRGAQALFLAAVGGYCAHRTTQRT